MTLSIQAHLLTPNPYSHPQIVLSSIRKLVIHWVANPSTSAKNNRNYFENLKLGTRGIYASSHYIIGLEGEILQCIPTNELAYHAKNANQYSLGIEVCHPDWKGEFKQITYGTLIALCAHLCHIYHLNPQTDILRHYDVTGKVCPKFYIHHPALWTKLKADIAKAIQQTYLQVNTDYVYKPFAIDLELNGLVKSVLAFEYASQYYIKLRDLEDNYFAISYDQAHKRLIVKIKDSK